MATRQEHDAAREANHIQFLIDKGNTPAQAEEKWARLRLARGLPADGDALMAFQASYGHAYAEVHPEAAKPEPVAHPSGGAQTR